uniref:DNA replication complex GINS protein PSF3 n=1 Tax=Ascaris suum TaxID=6253 RepID=F1KZV1_ASCSU
MLSQEVDEDYYNLNDIVACSSNVSCSFTKYTSKEIFPLIGQKAPDSVNEKGFKAEIPLFMAQALRRSCLIHLPKAFNTATQQVLQANAKSVDLQSLHQHFYRLGTHLALTIEGEEGRLLAETLLNTFVQRVGRIQTCSLNSMTKPKKLDTCEKQLHAIGVRTQSLMNDWTKGITSDMKRKASSTII